jgi:hypothetical protein
MSHYYNYIDHIAANLKFLPKMFKTTLINSIQSFSQKLIR